MKSLLSFFIIILIFGCAQQTQPTGGPKDETPPVLVSSTPANESTNYKETEIVLTFSEAVQLNNPKEQIVISPTVKETETIYRKDKVILTFKSSLRDSTTYNINFREAVQDLTEKNTASNIKLAFSTGGYIDSLTLSGNVFDLYTNTPMKDIIVAAHYANDTFNIFKHKADIFTKTNDKGFFTFENLKSTLFHLYAFQDKNKNLIVDSKNEKYGFLDKPISTHSDSAKNITLLVLSLDARPLKLISAKPFQNYFSIKANKGIAYSKIIFENNLPTIYNFEKDYNSIRLYQPPQTQDSIFAKIILKDSLHNTIDTTLYVKFRVQEKNTPSEKFEINLQKANFFVRDKSFSTEIRFNKPIKSINYDSLFIRLDSTEQINLDRSDIKLDTQKLVIYINKKLSDNKKISKTSRFINGAGAFISIDSDSSKRNTTIISENKEEDLGTIITEIETGEESYFIELLDNKRAVIKTIFDKKIKSFIDIVPGEYYLRVVIDKNKNGKWDPGNYFTKEEPEHIYYYKNEQGEQKFTLKANWELGPLLIKEGYPVEKMSKPLKK